MNPTTLLALIGLSLAAPACQNADAATAKPVRDDATGAPRGSASVVLVVEGMSCASCSIKVRSALKKLDGVSAVRPGDDDKRAIAVDYDPARVSPQAMVEAVEKAGYHARVK